MYGIILAGGRGERLRPITDWIPKSMIQVGGKPILEYQVLQLREAGVQNIIIAEGYLAERVQEYFGDGEHLGVNIQHLVLGREHGSAGIIRKALKGIPEEEPDVLLLYGDILSNYRLAELLKRHREASPAPLASLLLVEPNFLPHGIIIGNEDGIVREIGEEREVYSVNGGILVLNRKILPRIPESGDFSRDVLEPLSKNRALRGFKLEGYWGHITDRWSLERVREDWEEGRIFSFEGSIPASPERR